MNYNLKIFTLLFSMFLSLVSSVSLAETNYLDQSAEAKREFLWGKIIDSQYKDFPTTPFFTSFYKLLDPDYLRTSIVRESDFLPKGRKKLIHTYGSVAKFRLEIFNNSRFTGILGKGGKGLIRASLAHPLPSYTPGLAIKFLIDAKPSQNIFVMNSLDGQGDNRNFFQKTFSNKLQEPTNVILKPLLYAFDLAVQTVDPNASALYLSLDHLAKIETNGTVVESNNVVAPYTLDLIPMYNKISPDDKRDVREQLGQLKTGEILYMVVARESEFRWHPIGVIVLESPFIASRFGDEQLFFQHHYSND